MAYKPFIEPKKSQFNEQVTSSKNQIINLKSIYGVSKLRDVVTSTGNATIVNEGGLYKITTTADGTDSLIFDSAEKARYYAGQDAEAGLNIRYPVKPTGNQVILWGYFDDDNGFGFGEDSTGLFIFDISGGQMTKVYQTDWNIDKLNGEGPSKVDFDTSDGSIFHINFTWYSSGTINFDIVYFDKNKSNKQETYRIHSLRKIGEASIKNPNLPIRVKVDNAGSATPLEVFVGGRQFSTFGNPSAPRRVTGERVLNVTNIGTTPIPLISFKRKESFKSVSVKISGIDIKTDFDAIVEIRLNPSLTGASYGIPTNYTLSEVAVESDTSATAVTGGEVLYPTLVFATGAGARQIGTASIVLLEQDFIELQPISVVIRAVDGTTGTASCMFRVAEEW